MNRVIIYPNISDGGVNILYPMNCGFTLEEIALKDVPSGIPYKIINKEDLPSDRTFRDAWEADFSNPDGYGMGSEAFMRMKGGI